VSPGDVCIAEDASIVIPETPDEKRKLHPKGRTCVILSSAIVCNKVTHPILSVAPTTHRIDRKDITDFELLPTPQNGLKVESLVMLGHVQPIRKVDVFKKIGELSSGEWDLLQAHLLQILGI
jgi:mRNA-degrading endonuclease toxin of MazEF toxin-antitoxin module